jgi:hypothetical protein
MGERGPTPTLRTPPDEGSLAQTLEASLGTLTKSVGQVWEPGKEIATITSQPGSDTDGWKPISEYLRPRMMLDDEMETRHLVGRAKGYLIHNSELYHHSILGILERCNLIEEGMVLLLDIHEGIFGHHALSRSMVEKAFRQGFYRPTATSDTT